MNTTPTATRVSPRHRSHVVGVGGVVVRDDAVLLVRLAYSHFVGRYMLPGGIVEVDETIGDGVKREVLEETGVHATVDGVIGVRCRLDEGSLNLYVVFKMTYQSGDPRPEGRENDDARFFTLAEIEHSDDLGDHLVPYARHLSLRTLRGQVHLLEVDPYVPSHLAPGTIGWEAFA